MPDAPAENPLLDLGRLLRADGYYFVTPTPATHARVLQRATSWSDPLREVFGWSRPFEPDVLPRSYRGLLSEPTLFVKDGSVWRSQVRFSTLGKLLLAHSRFPTTGRDAVFLGPDTYRFCRAIAAVHDRDAAFRPRRVVDIGTGSGVGGLFASHVYPSIGEVILADINPQALHFAETNAALNAISFALSCPSDVLQGVEGQADLIISNPPYLVDPAHRAYRDGGGQWGDQLALRILQEALQRLAPGGALLLYTGSPIVGGRDVFWEAAQALLQSWPGSVRYEEVDPDVFGEELEAPPYDRADRIATTVLHVSNGNPEH